MFVWLMKFVVLSNCTSKAALVALKALVVVVSFVPSETFVAFSSLLTFAGALVNVVATNSSSGM